MKLGLDVLKCKFHDIDSINLRAENESFLCFLIVNLLLVTITMDESESYVQKILKLGNFY
jgi:hypothetical protein